MVAGAGKIQTNIERNEGAVMQAVRVGSRIARALAYVWIGILVLGIFAKLYLFVRVEGWWSGFASWREWFDPLNPLAFIVHVIEVLPALALFWLAGWLPFPLCSAGIGLFRDF